MTALWLAFVRITAIIPAFIYAIVVAALAVALSASAWQLGSARDALEKEKLERAAELSDRREAARKAEEVERVEETRRQTALENLTHELAKSKEALRAADARARSASTSLRAAVQSAAARGRQSCSNTSATSRRAGEQNSDPIGVLADVLGRADTRAGILAAHADELRATGRACEAYADSLKATK